MTTLAVAADALNKDSVRWNDASSDLQDGSTGAYGLDILQWSFPSQMEINLHPLYEQLQQKVGKLLAEGADETTAIANELIRVRDVLRGTDEAAQQEIESLWDYDS